MSARDRFALAALATCGGCNLVWGLTTQLDASPTTSQDAAQDAAIADQCIAAYPSDDFTHDPPCSDLGTTNGPAVAIADGALVVTLRKGAIDSGGCLGQADGPFAPGGFFANVLAAATGPEEYGQLRVIWDDGVTISIIGATASGLSFARAGGSELGSTPIIAPWWRIRPREDGNAILAESSPDGHHWTTFAIDPVTAPLSGRPEIQFGAFSADSRDTIARVASVDVCP